MNDTIHAFAALGAAQRLEPFTYRPGVLLADEVEIAVEHCGICHSDLSMLDNEWGRSEYPLVAGHEVVGRVVALGAEVKNLTEGQRVGLGWYARSCMVCAQCLGGDFHLCSRAQGTIVGRHGGFAERVRCHWAWAAPLPETLRPDVSGPLFCAGTTVFSPLTEFDVRPTDHVGVIGIGGLGHLALQFMRAWGCEVTAFTSHAGKAAELKTLGAHHVVTTENTSALEGLTGTFDFLLVTANAAQDWTRFLHLLSPRGRLHFVGAVLKPLDIPAFGLIGGQKEVSGSPLGRPATVMKMLDFAGRHAIAPQVEHFPMSRVNDALDRLRSGKARYRIVLDADF